MKIGILTFPNSTSYGAALQMYALYRTVEELGFDAEIINYVNSHMKACLHMTRMQKCGSLERKIRVALTQLLHCRQHLGFHKFEAQMVKYPPGSFSDKARLPQIGNRYAAMICGSDQVWNPDITNADLSYFLDFCSEDTARISYAPSFGVEKLPDHLCAPVKRELEQFRRISVREEAGRQIIRSAAQRQAALVIDPTLLLEAHRWREQEIPHSAARGDYILYYTVRSSDSLWRYCQELAKKHGLKILRIGSNVIRNSLRRSDAVEYVCDVSPGEWLYLMHHARCVVTNSFHGTAFSIIYRKDFFVEFSSLTNSRLAQIINTLGLNDQVVTSGAVPDSLGADYRNTEAVLPQIREESLNFLKLALKEVSEKHEKTQRS